MSPAVPASPDLYRGPVSAGVAPHPQSRGPCGVLHISVVTGGLVAGVRFFRFPRRVASELRCLLTSSPAAVGRATSCSMHTAAAAVVIMGSLSPLRAAFRLARAASQLHFRTRVVSLYPIHLSRSPAWSSRSGPPPRPATLSRRFPIHTYLCMRSRLINDDWRYNWPDLILSVTRG